MHNIIIEERKQLNISGVKDCKSFEEELVVLITEQGELTIKGTELHMDSFSIETGELVMNGLVYALGYTNENSQKGFLKRLIK